MGHEWRCFDLLLGELLFASNFLISLDSFRLGKHLIATLHKGELQSCPNWLNTVYHLMFAK